MYYQQFSTELIQHCIHSLIQNCLNSAEDNNTHDTHILSLLLQWSAPVLTWRE